MIKKLKAIIEKIKTLFTLVPETCENNSVKHSTSYYPPPRHSTWHNCCGNCCYMDIEDRNEWNECYCNYYGKYFPTFDRECNHFREW